MEGADGVNTTLLGDSVSLGMKELFSKEKKGPKRPPTPQSPQKRKNSVTTLVDGKRALKGGILLAAFKDFAAVRKALLGGDYFYLSLQNVDALLEIVPSTKDLAMVAAHMDRMPQGERLAECERYFHTVRDVPHLETRLRVLRLKHTFALSSTAIREGIAEHNAVCDAVKGSDALRRVLEVALELANTYHGQRSSGTHLSSLLEFLKMKASGDSRITLLHYLCSVLRMRKPELYDFPTQLKALARLPLTHDAIALSLRELQAQVNVAASAVTAMEDVDDTEGEDTFRAMLEGFCVQCADEAGRLAMEYAHMEETSLATTAYMGEPNLPVDQLLERLSSFISRYRQAQKEHTQLIKREMLGPEADDS